MTEKMNSQIYSHAAEYKEKTMNALNNARKSVSPSRPILEQVTRVPAERTSPLRQKSPTMIRTY